MRRFAIRLVGILAILVYSSTTTAASDVNLAAVAEPSSSHVSGDTSLGGTP